MAAVKPNVHGDAFEWCRKPDVEISLAGFDFAKKPTVFFNYDATVEVRPTAESDSLTDWSLEVCACYGCKEEFVPTLKVYLGCPSHALGPLCLSCFLKDNPDDDIVEEDS